MFLSDGGTEALEAARALVDRVEIHPAAVPGGKPGIELLGELSMVLRLAYGVRQKGPELGSLGPSVFGSINFGCGDRI